MVSFVFPESRVVLLSEDLRLFLSLLRRQSFDRKNLGCCLGLRGVCDLFLGLLAVRVVVSASTVAVLVFLEDLRDQIQAAPYLRDLSFECHDLLNLF